ncbi:PepSY-like domain-containing protein [Fulvivirgaceae bacterium BMA12]|uniref:PepSY-like domain-containing protein n=1 Tax=Agaribacillus aureus TaxID=3051825 RepID=A0ABT8L0B5_9BACT|nr:PepSY-like domain-containing protein [Fulvivirgaceae bacterium BMA12]
MIKGFRFLVLTVLILSACQSNFDTGTNIEAERKPMANDAREKPEAFIDQSLKLMYPNIGPYDLKIEQNHFATDFKIGGNHFKVKFDKNGDWVRSEVGIRFKKRIPEKIRNTVNTSDYADWFLADKTLIESPAKKMYKLEFQKGEEEWDVYFDTQGVVIKKDKEIKKTINR